LDLELRELETITLQETSDFFNKHIGLGPSGVNKKRLSVHIIAANNIAEIAQNDFSRKQQHVVDITEWKENLPLYPPFEEEKSL